MRVEHHAPTLRGPSFKWYTVPGLIVLWWRFWITGKPLFGQGDNATFFQDATVDYRGGPREKLTRARWRRVAWRWTVAGVPMLLADASPWITWYPLAGYVVLGVSGGSACAVIVFRSWWPMREIRKEYVYPTWEVICRVIGEKPHRRAAVRAIELPRGFGEEHPDDDGDLPELVVRVNLPAVPLDDGTKKRLTTTAGERLGIREPVASWTVKGARAYVELSPRQFPPRTLTYAAVRNLVLDASPTKPLVGLAAGHKAVYADLDNDGPHIGVSGGTGTGKSTLLRIILSRRVESGAGLVVCDYKIVSHKWARRIAQEDPHRVLYVTDEEPISEAILSVFAEFSRRREVLKVDASALAAFRPVDLLVEEVNTLADMLRTWWGQERRRIIAEAKEMDETPPYVPTICPAVSALAALVQMGRELEIRVHFAAQRLDASALSPKSGGAVRESITNRFLAKYTKQTWQMLCGGVPFEAFPGGPRGIWTAVVNGEVTHFRVPIMSEDEAYALAMSGEAPAGPVLGGARLIQSHERKVERLVTIKEAVECIPSAPKLDAARKRVQASELVPAGKRGNADLFDLRELERVLSS